MAAFDPANPFGAAGTDPYAQQKKQAVDNANAAGAGNLDAITRRYAAMGNLNSGSYTQALADQGRATQQQQENSLGNINAQEMQNSLPFAQQNIQNTFQGGELEKQLGSQAALQSQSLAQQQGQFNKTLPLQQQQLDLEASQQALDAGANSKNYDLAQQQLKNSGGLLGGGGLLGLGLGGGNQGGFLGIGGSSAGNSGLFSGGK